MSSLDVLHTFVRVARLKSFSAAAQELGIARGVVSKRVMQLEATLGQAVLSRSTRRVELTPAGELLVETVERALGDIALGFEAARELRHLPSGVLRVTAPVSWGQRALCPLLPGFLESHPQIEVELMLTDNLIDLAADRFDVGFRMSAAASPNMVAIAIAPMERHLCAAPAYLARMGKPRHPRELAEHVSMTYWSPTLQEPLRFDNGREAITIVPRGRLRANSPEAVLAAVLAGQCLGVLPTYACRTEMARGQLEVVLPRWRLKSRLGEQIHAVGTPERMRLARCRALVSFVRDALAQQR